MNVARIARNCGPVLVLALVACGGGRAAPPDGRDPCVGAQVQLWDDAKFGAPRISLRYPTEYTSLAQARADSGAQGFNDRITSAQWTIPAGCKLVLYEDVNFRGSRFQLIGSGRPEQNPNFGRFSDRASSVRWERS